MKVIRSTVRKGQTIHLQHRWLCWRRRRNDGCQTDRDVSAGANVPSPAVAVKVTVAGSAPGKFRLGLQLPWVELATALAAAVAVSSAGLPIATGRHAAVGLQVRRAAVYDELPAIQNGKLHESLQRH